MKLKLEHPGNMGGGGLTFMGLLVVVLLSLVTMTWSFCPQYCHCDDSSLKVDCHSASKLMVVPIVLNPRIKSLSLSHNQIKEITMAFQFYTELTTLDLSRNLIQSLGTTNFELLKHLEVLNVSYNSVKAVEKGAFQGLGSLRVLDLRGNQIERVEREIFWGLKDIREILLDRNRLEFIDWELFRGLHTLQRISLQYNFIQLIEPSANLVSGASGAWTLKSLLSLDVSSNQVTRVKENSLSVFSGLSELNLCCNYIHTLEEKSLLGLPLRKLNLSQNRLGRVPTTVLGDVSPSLLSLDLSSNRLSDSLPKGSFATLLSLQSLFLNDNPGVVDIHPDALQDLISLQDFQADYLPNLTQLSSHLVDNKPELRRFSLRYAHIAQLPPELLDLEPGRDLPGAAGSLDLTGNPLECNCSAWPLFQFLQEHGDKIHNHPDQQFDHLDPDLGLLLPHHSSSNSNLSQAQYVDQGQSHSQGSNTPGKKSPHPRPFYLSSVRCGNPQELSGILVKDLKSSDFSSCFTTEDHFQLLVIVIAASLLVLIMLIIGVKICCLGQSQSTHTQGCSRCRKMCRKLGKLPCCHRKKEIDDDLGKSDRLFDGLGLRRDLPAPPMNHGQGQNLNLNHNHNHPFLGANGGKLFFSESNHGSPIHHNHNHNLQTNPMLFYSVNNYGGGGGHTHSGQSGTVPRKDYVNSASSVGGGGGGGESEGGYQIVSAGYNTTGGRNNYQLQPQPPQPPSYNHNQSHNFYNYQEEDDENEYHNPEGSLVLGSGAGAGGTLGSNPMLLRYDYENFGLSQQHQHQHPSHQSHLGHGHGHSQNSLASGVSGVSGGGEPFLDYGHGHPINTSSKHKSNRKNKKHQNQHHTLGDRERERESHTHNRHVISSKQVPSVLV